MAHIKIDQERCIGCGACAEICDNFEIIDGKARVKDQNPKESGCSEKAKNICPVVAIEINEEGK